MVGTHEQRDKHVTKRAVNNADGQCCELRWYAKPLNGTVLCLPRRDAAESPTHRNVVRASLSSAAANDPETNRVVTLVDAFLFRNWCFLRRRDFCRPRTGRGRRHCRNKVTLLPVTLRRDSKRAFLRLLS